MSFGRRVTMRKRVTSAGVALVANVVLWIVIPYYLGAYLSGVVPDLALAIPAFVFEFGVLFVILDVGAAFFQGMAVSVPFISGAALLSAAYLWLVTDGGDLQVTAAGTTIGLQFQLLLYVLVLPSLWAALRAPLSYLAWRGASMEPPAVP
ncbi:MAG: hypothetical protein JRN11_05620 [Nitrososphaerota archaeon]|nr:hypothetical protein [Nitrososphaerota archaeon]MDG7026210.1 hypothetical protein [Nitrososphaerota archaeon]